MVCTGGLGSAWEKGKKLGNQRKRNFKKYGHHIFQKLQK